MSKKRCQFCGEEFAPAPRHWNQQNTCKKARCRKERDKYAQKRWVKEYPDCFRGRYPALKKSWDYQNYLREYRKEHPEYVTSDNRARRQRQRREKRRADIQETVTRRRAAITAIRFRHSADIQESVRMKLDGVLDYLEESSADIQISMARAAVVGV